LKVGEARFGVVPDHAAPSRARGAGLLRRRRRHRPRNTVRSPRPARPRAVTARLPKPAAEMPEERKAAREAMRTCTWCGYQWLSPTPFRRTRCPLCTCLTS
jgi:hypothetical protein